MMTMFEDLTLALRQMCRAIGLSGTASTVVPLVVLGVALNAVALSATGHMRNERHPIHANAMLQGAVRTELKVMRTVLHSTLKKIGDGQRRWCLAQQWMVDRRLEVARHYLIEVGFVWAVPGSGEGCGVEIVGSHHRKAIAFVQC